MINFKNKTSVLFSFLGLFSVILYSTSLFLPAFHFTSHDPVLGYTVLFLGWFGFFSLDFAWLTNPLYIASLIMAQKLKYKKAMYLALLSVPFTLLSLLAKEWWFNEAIGTPITKLGDAYYIWLSSLIIWLLALVLKITIKPKY